MSYVQQTLLPNEQVLHQARLHWTLFLHWKSLLTLTIWAWVLRASSEFAVTNRRVIIKVGLIQRKTVELQLSKVETIEVEQGFWARLFGIGAITIVGTGGTSERFEGLGDPLGFRRAVHRAVELLQPASAGAVAALPASERLAQAEELLRRGQISQAEFDALRGRILADM
jgi:uncharacterized membrane protein YdbT with pleckstrin-like domain